ncbi:hypothetical protein [Thermoactinomyces sp. DSM 45892]|uniref:HAAS domain-containing protein n=1 Tax=Thermoactinomyces sp. DSM 45892 TaxID=1882753 RepID=UPI00089517D9|nr:hypothetical protein [Thermoactinomyces sp. DSM 45892]SDZ04875.1 hypothetical protein SAMN05444416_11270 [Thermoactinomyces sp. DSM 45892]
MMVSKESQSFLDNLKVYLYSSGKKEQEIKEIVEELRDHLHEAEKNGKGVDDIIGMTPRDYMEQLANEMPFDLKGWLKYLPMIFIGALAYTVMGDAIEGNVKYSLIECIGYPFLLLLSLFSISMLFKYISSHKVSSWKERILFVGVAFVIPTALFVALIFLGKPYSTTVIHLGDTGNVVSIVLSALVFVGVAIWSRTWDAIILPAILFVPGVLLKQTNLTVSTKEMLSLILSTSGICLYAFITIKRNKTKDID